jgi:hypothetical protein
MCCVVSFCFKMHKESDFDEMAAWLDDKVSCMYRHQCRIVQVSIVHYRSSVTLNVKIDFVKNGVFWDVTPCGCCKNRCFGGT